MKFSDYVIPESLDDARTTLKQLGESGYAFAGGTAFQYLSERPGVTAVDISRLGLKGIERKNGAFHIGALTTLTDLARYREEGWILHRIATLIPTHQIRNISTVGGNIARLFPWSELPLGLLVLDASIVVQGDEEQRYPAEEFFAGRPSQLLKAGDIVTAVEIPALMPQTGFGYKKETTTNAAFALMSAAAAVTLEGDTLRNVRVAAGSALPVPTRMQGVESELEGKAADEQLFQDAVKNGIKDASWQGREGQSDEFGQHLAEIIIVDALTDALKRARGEDK